MRRIAHRSPTTWLVPLVLLFGALGGCGDDDSGSDQAFGFENDDLCAWVTPDEVAGFFTSVYGIDVTAEPDPNVTIDPDGPDECWWRLTAPTGEGYYEVFAGNADPGVLLPVEEITPYDGGTVGIPGGTVSEHPALSDGVVVQSSGWGVYVFWVPPHEEYLAMFLNHRVGTTATGVDSADDPQEREEQQTRFFAFADQFVRELGWVS